MKVKLLSASQGKNKTTGRPVLILSYCPGPIVFVDEERDVGKVGLQQARSYVPEIHQEAVWQFIQELLEEGYEFPVDVELDITTSNGKTVQVSGISHCTEGDDD